MADTAAHWVDRVLPEVPIRQWVLTLPYPLRYRCAYDSKLTSQVLRAFVRSLFAGLRRRARSKWGVHAQQCGSITFIQRFGSALNMNVHFHALVLDGAYSFAPGRGNPPRFLALPPPGASEVARVLAGTARRIQRVVEVHDSGDADALERDEPLLSLLAAASLRTCIATGPDRGKPWRRLGDRVEPRETAEAEVDPEASERVPQFGGMSLHADVAVPARDRKRLERLCRYVARPPLANERLEEQPDGRIALRLKTRWRDGTTHVLMERSELIERLVPLIPPPRAHQVRYHGILAPCASVRDLIVPGRLGSAQDTQPKPPGRASERVASEKFRADTPLAQPEGEQSGSDEWRGGSLPPDMYEPWPKSNRRPVDKAENTRRMRWAALLQRVFEIDALRCPRCGSTLRLIAAIEDPETARRILECLELPARAPPLGDATSLPDEPACSVDDFLFDQSSTFDEP
jgi:hypothetical protein